MCVGVQVVWRNHRYYLFTTKTPKISGVWPIARSMSGARRISESAWGPPVVSAIAHLPSCFLEGWVEVGAQTFAVTGFCKSPLPQKKSSRSGSRQPAPRVRRDDRAFTIDAFYIDWALSSERRTLALALDLYKQLFRVSDPTTGGRGFSFQPRERTGGFATCCMSIRSPSAVRGKGRLYRS